MTSPADAARYTLRALARRYQQLAREVDIHQRLPRTLTERAAATLATTFGVGAGCAAELLIVAPHAPPPSHHRPRHPTHSGRQDQPEIMRCLKRLLAREIYNTTLEKQSTKSLNRGLTTTGASTRWPNRSAQR